MNHFRNLFIASLLSSGAYAQNSSSQAEQDLANSLKSQQSIRNNVQSETANPWSRTFPDPWVSQFWGGTTGKQTLAGGADLVAARWLYKAASRIDLLAGEKVKDITQVADVKEKLEKLKILSIQTQPKDVQQSIIDSLEKEQSELQKLINGSPESKNLRGHYTENEIKNRIEKIEQQKNSFKQSMNLNSVDRQKAYATAKQELKTSLDSIDQLSDQQKFFAHNHLATQFSDLRTSLNPSTNLTNIEQTKNRILELEKKGVQSKLLPLERLELDNLYQKKLNQMLVQPLKTNVSLAATLRDLDFFYTRSAKLSSDILTQKKDALAKALKDGDLRQQKIIESEIDELRNGHYQGATTGSRKKQLATKCTQKFLYLFAFKEVGTAAWRVLYATDIIPGQESGGDPGWAPLGTYLMYCLNDDGEPIGDDLSPEEKAKIKEYYQKSQQNLPVPQAPTLDESTPKKNH